MPRFLKSLTTVAFTLTGGSPGNGKVLVSDAQGNASWSTIEAGVSANSVGEAELKDGEIALYVKLNSEVFG
jgi:hypothetical protein